MQTKQEIYLLGRIGDVIKDNPRVVKFILNGSISTRPLRSSFSRTKIDVSVDLLLLNIRDECENVAVTIGVSRINVPDPLINVIKRSQMLIPLH